MTSTSATSIAAPSTTVFSGKRPNIVFVLTDDLAWNLVQYMPHVQQLQARGATFSNYFVTDSLCCPSRSSIFSGRYPHDTGVFTNVGKDGGYQVFHDRGEESDTFATSLQAVGYDTAMMGKYLNGYDPKTSGVPPGWNEWDVAGNGYPEFNYDLNSNGTNTHYGQTPEDYLVDVMSNKAVSFIDQSAAANKPFMMELATFAPHAPYTPAPRDANKFPGLTAPRTPAFGVVDTVGQPHWLANEPPLDKKQIAAIDDAFRKRAQAVQSVDQMIGHIEDELAAKGLTNDTYIVFSSDNGYHMGEHRLHPGKMTAFDTDIKVPLVIAGPAVPPGQTITAIAQNIDLRPTFAELGGAPTPPTVDGHSLAGLAHGQPPGDWRSSALVEHHGPVTGVTDPDLPDKYSGNPPTYNAIRTAAGVYVEYVDGEREYYDTTTDPDELANIAGQLSTAEQSKLHTAIVAISNCHNAIDCWAAQRLPT